MFKIYDGRDHFYQWDLNRKLIVGDTVKEVHFCNRTDNCSLVCETYTNEDGLILVDVPNILLQTDWKINVYAYDGLCTKHNSYFDVVSRTKPADYIYTETEVKRYEDLEDRIAMLEASGEVDLSNYYTKEETDSKDEKLQQDIYDLQADIVGREEKSNKVTLRGSFDGSWNNYNDNQYLSAAVVGEHLIMMEAQIEARIETHLEEEVGDIEKALDAIEALQNKYIGGESA